MVKSSSTILITAGEASGDRLGAALMAELKKLNPNLTFIGTGGDEMMKQGLNPEFPMSDLAVMGLLEVIPSIPRILGRINQLAELVEHTRPAAVITIDAQDFSARLAKRLKPLGIPHIQYVAPKVWAWRQHRVKKLKSLFAHLLTILPFEPEFFQSAGIPTTYVGHPATTMLAKYQNQPPKTPVLALLPGSRGGELKRHWPLFLQTYRALRAENPKLTAILALPNEKALLTCQSLAEWGAKEGIMAVFGDARFTALAKATAALSKSGTNNLELALIGTPAVVTYQMNPITHWLATYLVKIPYVSLPNIILNNVGKPTAYPELIQGAATVETLCAALNPLLHNQKPAESQRKALQALHKLMETPKSPAAQAAAIVAEYL